MHHLWRRLAPLGLSATLALIVSVPAAPAKAASPPATTCSVFPADNVWNTDISGLPVNSHSAAWLGSTGATTGRKLHPDFGGPPYGIPFNVVTNTHATANFNFLYWDESDPIVATQQSQGPYPSGSDLLIEGPTDSHMLTINSDTCRLYETSGTDISAHTGWSGAIFDLNSNALRPNTWTSADAAGLPIFPGLVRLDEVVAGAINHAIRFTVQQSDTTYLWPARHQAGSAGNPNLPPMGARFRLKAGYNIAAFNAQTQVVLTAMKHYGLIVADNGSNWFFQGTMDAGWANVPYATMVSQLKTIPASAFEAVDESSMMVDPNSGQASPPCAAASISPAGPSQPAGATIAFTAGSTKCLSPHYAYWLRYPGGKWYLKRPFSTDPAFSFNTSFFTPGAYVMRVWANQVPSATRYDTFAETSVTLTGCTSATLTPPTGSASVATPVQFTAAAVGCPQPLYEFWVQDTVGKWHRMTGFGGPTWTWNHVGWARGVYHVRVWANQQGAYTGSYEVFGASTYTLN